MQLKIITIALLTIIISSCATKSKVPVSENKKTEISNELVEGKNLYDNNCAKCHKLYSPKSFTAEEWKPILTEMQKKAKLNDTQIASISNYINSQL